MKGLAIFTLALAAAVAFCDHINTGMGVKGWNIQSTENLYAGRIHRGYPLINMIDGDPKTAWVFSGKKPNPKATEGLAREYALYIVPDKPTQFNGFRIMNGYNKSKDIFYRNNRITGINVYQCDDRDDYEDHISIVKTANLSDQMGWHTVSLPSKKYYGLKLVFTDFKQGPDRDVCISELQLLLDGKPVGFGHWKAYDLSDGDDCGDGTEGSFYSKSGQILASYSDASLAVSQDGRYYGGIDSLSENIKMHHYRLWILDFLKGNVLVSKDVFTKDYMNVDSQRYTREFLFTPVADGQFGKAIKLGY